MNARNEWVTPPAAVNALQIVTATAMTYLRAMRSDSFAIGIAPAAYISEKAGPAMMPSWVSVSARSLLIACTRMNGILESTKASV